MCRYALPDLMSSRVGQGVNAVSVGGLERVDAVAPRLLLGFALSNGSKPWGAEQGAEQQCMGTCVWVDAHRC